MKSFFMLCEDCADLQGEDIKRMLNENKRLTNEVESLLVVNERLKDKLTKLFVEKVRLENNSIVVVDDVQ